MLRAVLATALLLAAPCPAPGAQPSDGGSPESFERVSSGPITVLHAPENAGLAREVAARAAAHHERIRADLGLEREVPVDLLLLTARSPADQREEWARRLPRWYAGAADAGRQFAVIRVRPGQTPRDLDPLVAHELAHVILKGDYPAHDSWPLWFREGLAMRLSRDEGFRDFSAISLASLRDRLLPFESLRDRFPASEAGARLAYAQSASFLGFIVGEQGAWRFAELMRRLRGNPFDEAFRRVYGAGAGAMETRWRQWVRRRYAWVPAATSAGAFWALISVLFFVALWFRRRKDRRLREEWEREDPEEDSAA